MLGVLTWPALLPKRPTKQDGQYGFPISRPGNIHMLRKMSKCCSPIFGILPPCWWYYRMTLQSIYWSILYWLFDTSYITFVNKSELPATIISQKWKQWFHWNYQKTVYYLNFRANIIIYLSNGHFFIPKSAYSTIANVIEAIWELTTM